MFISQSYYIEYDVEYAITCYLTSANKQTHRHRDKELYCVDKYKHEALLCFSVILQLEDGCYTINVSRSDVGYDRYTEYQWGVNLEIEARVKEQGTGE